MWRSTLVQHRTLYRPSNSWLGRVRPFRHTTPFSTSSDDSSATGAQPTPDPPRRRRHRFGNVDNLPSFAEFQQQQKVRKLYRDFVRLAYTSVTDRRAQKDMVRQIRHEFKTTSATTDAWNTKRAVSEGTRRYKDVAAMLGTSSNQRHPQSASPNDESYAVPTRTSQWPWQAVDDHGEEVYSSKARPRPLPIPKKTL
jgi:hypothetical protein